MAFESKHLSVLAYSNGFTLWHYASEDGMNEVGDYDMSGIGYFDEAHDMLRNGDMIMANLNTDKKVPQGAMFLVTNSSGGHVEIVTMNSSISHNRLQ